MPNLQLVQDPAADALLESNPLALLIGMLLDQQVEIRLRLWRSKLSAPSSALVYP
jgi:hypothetical protein